MIISSEIGDPFFPPGRNDGVAFSRITVAFEVPTGNAFVTAKEIQDWVWEKLTTPEKPVEEPKPRQARRNSASVASNVEP